ncbi:MAG TPA: hypothetical protein ENI61_06645 [Ignavibacteria bacterium]|nr:hypothetical protein [Ignavibacteria bacterium]
MDCFDIVYKSQGKWINIYGGIETVDDPFEKNVVVTNLNPIPIKAIVSDFTAAKAQWAMPGVNVSQMKEIYVPIKYRTLIESSQKIGIKNSTGVEEYFEGWRESGKMQIREEGNQLRLYVYNKQV